MKGTVMKSRCSRSVTLLVMRGCEVWEALEREKVRERIPREVRPGWVRKKIGEKYRPKVLWSMKTIRYLLK